MARQRIKWNRSAFEEIRRSPEVEDALQALVNDALAELGDHDGVNYVGGVEPGRSRSRGYVVTVSGEAVRAEAEDHALVRALGVIRA